MLKLNKMADYGVLVLGELSQHPEESATVNQLSEKTGIPSPSIAKLMKRLAKGGLVNSHRGIKGGYYLNNPLGKMNLAELLVAIDGPIALTSCIDETRTSCHIKSLCPMRSNWHKVNQAIKQTLESISMADMLISGGLHGPI